MSETWTWATVTGVSPLRVRLDGETDPLTTTPETMVAGLMVGDRVRVQLHGRQAIVTGRATGTYDSGWVTLTLEAGFTATQAFQIRRIGPVVYMRGAVLPSTDWGAIGANNTVVAAGGVPADMRPNSSFVTYQALAASSAGQSFRMVVQVDGSILVSNQTTASSTSNAYFGGAAWPVG